MHLRSVSYGSTIFKNAILTLPWARHVMASVLAMCMLPGRTAAQQTSNAQPSEPQTEQTAPSSQVDATYTVSVIGTTPLPGVELPPDWIPAPTQTATDRDVQSSGALDISSFLARRMTSVHVNDMQNNPFQPDLNYRGFTASSLLGTPQGLSVYMDGVRLNQPFGEVVSWDLIPRMAIATTTLIPGSNPLFGLNTLGGALALQMKDGRHHGGTTVQATYGSNARRLLELEHGGRTKAAGFHWYIAANLFRENDWRTDVPSDVRQLFGKIGWQRTGHDLTISMGHANNLLSGNGLQDERLLERDYSSVYTKPDTTDNQSTLFNVSSRHRLNARVSVLVNAYYRDIGTRALNGDLNDDSLDQPLYQPNVQERIALEDEGFGAVPSSGLNASNTLFPSLRCIANVLLDAEPAEQCNGLINRTRTAQHNGGAAAQLTRRDPIGRQENVFTAGAALDGSSVAFTQSTELGYLNPDRRVVGLNAFGDGVTGGDLDGEPYDVRVDMDGSISTWSMYAANTLPMGERVHVTLSGRYNRTSVENRDRLQPGGGAGSLDGRHTFSRFNPAAGITFSTSRSANVYAGYSEGSRAATSIELGCADPEQPCRLPNAMAGDPPLNQVVTKTWEGGVRGSFRRLAWNVAAFRAVNRDDILFVTSEQTGFGYFKNFGKTRRQGLELGMHTEHGRVALGAGYTYLHATFESKETLNGESNSSNDAALTGARGLDGSIEITPGDRIPLVPAQLFKAFADVQVTSRLGVNVNVIAVGRSYARGNENNRHTPDGVYYLGPGAANAYRVVNLGARYALTRRLQMIGQVDNLFDRKYFTAAQLGPAGFTEAGAFIAQPLPPIDGEFPVRQTTFLAPGAPLRAWIGARVRF